MVENRSHLSMVAMGTGISAGITIFTMCSLPSPLSAAPSACLCAQTASVLHVARCHFDDHWLKISEKAVDLLKRLMLVSTEKYHIHE